MPRELLPAHRFVLRHSKYFALGVWIATGAYAVTPPRSLASPSGLEFVAEAPDQRNNFIENQPKPKSVLDIIINIKDAVHSNIFTHKSDYSKSNFEKIFDASDSSFIGVNSGDGFITGSSNYFPGISRDIKEFNRSYSNINITVSGKFIGDKNDFFGIIINLRDSGISLESMEKVLGNGWILQDLDLHPLHGPPPRRTNPNGNTRYVRSSISDGFKILMELIFDQSGSVKQFGIKKERFAE